MWTARTSLLLALVACGDKDTTGSDAAFADADADGFPADIDCDDADASAFPGAVETCDGVDNDCDGETDEDALDATAWFADADGDGFGDEETEVVRCDAPSGFIQQGGDCDDTDGSFHPAAEETDCTDPHDYNCDGSVGYADRDGDGVPACQDCDDADSDVHPGAAEVCDGDDNDCDGETDNDAVDALTWFRDADGDRYGDVGEATAACLPPTGFVRDGTDCDDGSASVNPNATELCNEIDDDCDLSVDEDDAADTTRWYDDSDEDGYGDPSVEVRACTQPTGMVADDTDCDPGDGTVSPGTVESCDGEDNDCDGTVDEDDAEDALDWHRDADGDGFGDATVVVTACTAPVGHVADDLDCDDGDSGVSPDATERCDSIDNDCDGTVDEDDAIDASTWYADADGDGYGDADSSVTACAPPSGYVVDDTDCDDGDASVSSTCFPDFDGTVGAAWTALASPGDDLYSLMVYQTDDIPVLVNAYASGGAGAQQYDPTTDTWSTDAAAVPYNSPWTSMAPWNGDLWMIRNGFVYQYEVATGTWTVVTTSGALDDLNMTESDEFGVIYGHDSRGYMVEYDTTTGSVSFFVTGLGGQYETRLAYDPGTRSIFYGAYDEPELYRYDIASKGSAAVSPIPESQLNDIFCADRSGHIYAAGGSGGTTMFQYDIASDSWSAIPDLPTDHGNNGSCTVSADGWLYVGAGSNRTFYRVELY